MNRGIRRVGIAVTLLLLVLVGQLTYLQIVDADHLDNDPRNLRSVLRDINRPRGEIRTADGQVLARSVESTDQTEFKYQREYPLGGLTAQVVGATLTGTVTDASGGAIAGAQISCRNLATDVARGSDWEDGELRRKPRWPDTDDDDDDGRPQNGWSAGLGTALFGACAGSFRFGAGK